MGRLVQDVQRDNFIHPANDEEMAEAMFLGELETINGLTFTMHISRYNGRSYILKMEKKLK